MSDGYSINFNLKTYLKKRKKFLKKFDEFTCTYCHQTVPKEEITVDHIIPLSMGGAPYDPTNFCLACYSCNSLKSNMLPEEFEKVKEQKFAEVAELLKGNYEHFLTATQITKPLLERDQKDPTKTQPILTITRQGGLLHHGFNHSSEEKEPARLLSLKVLGQFTLPYKRLHFQLDIRDNTVFFFYKQTCRQVFLK